MERVPTDKYNLLTVSPEDFRRFLTRWVVFLQSLDLTATLIQDDILNLSNGLEPSLLTL